MKRILNVLFSCVASLICLSATAQKGTIVSGSVKVVKSGEAIAAVSVTIKGTSLGTFTNEKGEFKFTTTQKPPFTLVLSSVGYASKEVNFTGDAVKVELTVAETLGQEVTVSASRVSERVLESPVTIEKIGLNAIRTAAAPNYYDMLTNLKGVDVVNASLTFRSVGTRGFNSSGNLRLNQIVDGMDNQAPGLNFAVGSICGLTELDVESLELLPGASSALYGPGGMNGTVIINAKDPFKYQGLSFQVKAGANHIDQKQRSTSAFTDWSVRWAKKINDKWAYKIGAQLTNAKDWVATDATNYNRVPTATTPNGNVIGGTRTTDPNYDGINFYGDETSVDIRPFMQGAIAANPGLSPILTQFLSTAQNVSRTGYAEKDVIDPTTINVKLSGQLSYKITPKITASFTSYYGTGNTVYTGADRYSLKDLKIAQHKIEIRHKNWFVRAYKTFENSGSSFNATVTTRLFNESWKASYNPNDVAASWYPQYTGAFAQGAATVFGQAMVATGGNVTASQAAVASNALALHNAARAFADQGRPTGFIGANDMFKQIASTPISAGGGLFVDKTSLSMIEAQANLTEVLGLEKTKADIIIGGNYKRYVLNSNGTLFAENLLGGTIPIDEYGGYLQASCKFLEDKLKLTASGRYDKNSNFEPKFTPRVSAVYQVKKDHNIRVSYQTAYRFPSTQNQYINLLINGGIRLMGGLPILRDKYNFANNPAYTLASLQAAAAASNPALLKVQTFDEFKPESMNSIEVGYKGLFAKKLLVDVYAYMGKYSNFIGDLRCVQSNTGSPLGLLNASTRTIYSISSNLNQDVTTKGWGLSAEYMFPKNFYASANVYGDMIDDLPSDFISYFNTPKTRANISVGNNGFGCDNRVVFNVVVRTQASMHYEGTFGVSDLPGYTTVDAMLGYKYPKIKSILKIGATNLYNKYYRTGFGSPAVGGLYYVSFGYNIF
ncbi:unnamed protein product [Rotaria sp. Silwood1]|nr:unnamed protein product [Rotaria sp. Silwood1]